MSFNAHVFYLGHDAPRLGVKRKDISCSASLPVDSGHSRFKATRRWKKTHDGTARTGKTELTRSRRATEAASVSRFCVRGLRSADKARALFLTQVRVPAPKGNIGFRIAGRLQKMRSHLE